MENEGTRLNKYISSTGLCSRREADRLISEGHVEIIRGGADDSEKTEAALGDRFLPGDRILVDGKPLKDSENEKLYMMMNKPKGIICTGDKRIKENVVDYAGITHYISYAGRLDKDSTGLLLLTNDGDLNNKIMKASNFHEKEYIVTVDKVLTTDFLNAMRAGMKIVIDDESHLTLQPGTPGHPLKAVGMTVVTRPCKVTRTGARKFSIVLTQGYNRQIRRMCEAGGFKAIEIQRIRIMNLQLGDLKEGRKRFLTANEIKTLKEMAEMKEERHISPPSGRTKRVFKYTAGPSCGNTNNRRNTSYHAGQDRQRKI